jgi:hypothetical protein
VTPSGRPRVWAWAALLLLGVLLRAPSLAVGRLGDDWYHLSMIEGTYPVPRSATNLFDFVRDDPAEHQRLRDRGVFPWWTTPSLKLAPWRPLTSATLALDHALFGRSPVGPHVVSLLAWAALLVAAAWWLREALPEPAALLAFALLCLDESATAPVAWIANRASLLALAFGLVGAGILARTRGRRDPRALAAVAAPFALSALAGEYGLAVVGAVVAYELLADPDARRTGRPRLVAALAPGVAYVVAWKLLGYGARGSSAYVDPLSQPVAWLTAARTRSLAFVGELVSAVPIAATLAAPAATLLALALNAALAAVVIARADALPRRTALATLAAAATALLPVLSAPLNGRVLLPAAPFFAAALASLGWCAWSARPGALTWLSRGAMALWIAVHLTVSPALAWAELHGLAAWRPTTIPWRSLPHVDTCRAADQDHLLLLASDFGMIHTAGLYWQARGCAQPRTWRTLAASQGAAIVLRDGDASLDVRTADGGSVLGLHGILWRTEPPYRVGERFTARGFAAEVLAVADGRPTRVRYQFERSLDDPRVVLWMITTTGFEQIAPPAVGRGRLVPHVETHFW